MKTIAVVSTSSEIPSSALAVVSNDDLLIEILLRVPVASLLVLKTVSKRWLTLITNPIFTLRRNQNPNVDPPSALFIKRIDTSFKYDFVPLDVDIPSPTTTLISLDFDSHNVKIMQSCNGLILCGDLLDKDHEFLYVYNPSTNRFKTIHQPPLRRCYVSTLFSDQGGLRMAFDPSKSPHYKILYAELMTKNARSVFQVHIYSSETCNWSVCRDRFPNFLGFEGFDKGMYWNGAIHWLDDEAVHHMLDVEHPEFKYIRTPHVISPGDCRKLFQSNACLLLLCPGPFGFLHIYKMSKRCSSWSLKCIVTLDVIRMKYKTRQRKSSKWFISSVQCIMTGKKEEDLFLVMEIDGEIIKYEIASKTISTIYQLADSSPSWVDSFEFIASFAAV